MTQKNLVGGRRLGVAAGAVAASLAAGWLAAGPALAAQPPSAEVAGITLTVTGTGAADRIALRLTAGAPGTLEVDFDDNGVADRTVDRSTFSRIDVFALGGDDQFRVDQVNGTFVDETMEIDGGRGNDILDGGDGNEVFMGRAGNDAIDGNKGDDVGELGSGDDSFRWDPGDGSDRVEGERGFDTLDFNGGGTEIMSLSANGERSLFLRNVGNIRMDMGEVERLDLDALGGTDTITIDDMTGTDFRQADVDLSVPPAAGDAAVDLVTINGSARPDQVAVDVDGTQVAIAGLKTTTQLIGSEVADQLLVNTLGGDDDVAIADAVPGVIDVAADLGADQR